MRLPCDVITAASSCAVDASDELAAPESSRRRLRQDGASEAVHAADDLASRLIARRARRGLTREDLAGVDHSLQQLPPASEAFVIRAVRPWASAISEAARLPLSTVETYRGCRGASVAVSYQLRSGPRAARAPRASSACRSSRRISDVRRQISEIVRGQRRQAAPCRCWSERSAGRDRGSSPS